MVILTLPNGLFLTHLIPYTPLCQTEGALQTSIVDYILKDKLYLQIR